MNLITPNSRTKEVTLTRLSKKREKINRIKTDVDDNTGIFHVFEMWFAVNEFNYHISALQERPEKFPFRPFLQLLK